MKLEEEGAGPAIPVLAYHFTGEPLDDEDAPFTVSEASFEAQMSFFAAGGYSCIRLEQVMQAVRQKTLPDKAVAITFDDGRACTITRRFRS